MNNVGRMPGASRYMSSEEFQLGATAFQLFGGGSGRSLEKWEAGEKLYCIALKAINIEKGNRYQTIDEYFEAWNDTSIIIAPK
jgi:serine/threonine protein kinase, bacterial